MKELSISADFKCTATRGNKCERLDTLAEFENLGRQTDGLRRVVSNDAIFYRHFGLHFELLSETKVIGAVKSGQEAGRNYNERRRRRVASVASPSLWAPRPAAGRPGDGAQIYVSILKGKVQTASDHAEVILRTVNDTPAQIVRPTDMAGDSNFEAGAELS
jgi:hypothetical protein